MGRQIVYCEGCGNSLREDDFERGRARTIDNRPYCTECRPFKEGAEPAPRRSSSGKVPAQPPPANRKTSTGHIPILPAPRRPAAAPSKGSNPLPVLAGVGGVAFLLLLIAVTQGGTRRAPPPEPAPPPPLVEIPVPRPPAGPVPLPPPPQRDPPPPPVRRDPPPPEKPSGPLVAPSAAEKFEAFLTQIKQMIRDDVRKERTDEILNMFTAAEKTAGPRGPEVAKLRSEYLQTIDDPARRAAAWSEWKITSSTEAGNTGLLQSYGERTNVYMTHPIDPKTPAKLEREVMLPAGKKTTLTFWVSCHQQGDFELRVFADDKQLVKEIIGPAGSGWRQKSVDLSTFAGKRIALRLEDFPNDWAWEFAYWSDIVIASE